MAAPVHLRKATSNLPLTPSPQGRGNLKPPNAKIFIVFGVPLEYEWLVRKLCLGTPSFAAKLNLAIIFVPKYNLGTRLKRRGDPPGRPFCLIKGGTGISPVLLLVTQQSYLHKTPFAHLQHMRTAWG